MAIVTRSYEYRDIYVSLLKYLGDVALRVAAKYDVPPLSVMNLDSVSQILPNYLQVTLFLFPTGLYQQTDTPMVITMKCCWVSVL